MHILLADDDPILSAAVAFRLEALGYAVTVVEDGQAAWEAAEKQTFDLVLTDYQMPNLNGIELCQRLRTHPDYAATPLVMMSAHAYQLDRTYLTRQLGVAAIFSKPFNLGKLGQTIGECLNGKRFEPAEFVPVGDATETA